MTFLGFSQDTVPSNAVQGKDYSPQIAQIAHSPPGFQRRVVVSKAKLALNIITTSIDSTRVLSFNRRICWPKMLFNDVKVSGMILFKHSKRMGQNRQTKNFLLRFLQQLCSTWECECLYNQSRRFKTTKKTASLRLDVTHDGTIRCFTRSS